MCARNAVVAFNETMSRKLVKNKSHGRIDGMVALAMAAAVAGTWEQAKRVDVRTMLV
jgi:phage terminase large subunit-like protein